ncbi:MAG TPA: alpha/beta-hydrolase family protein [Acidimicrobiia bacterium]
MSSESATGLMVNPVPKAFSRPVSRPGVLTGVLMFVTSLLPSLLPRLAVTQGIVSGISFMVGYGLGVAWHWTWNFLGMPQPKGRWWLVIRRIWFVVLALLLVAGMWGFVGWQNDVRDDFGMERITPAIWLIIVPVAFVFSALILVISRLILKLLHFLIRWLGRVFPLRLAVVLGGAALAMILWGLWSGLAVNTFFAVTNQIFAPRDTITPEGIIAPTSELRSGSPESLVTWETLGERGRTFVATGPMVDDLNAFHGDGAIEPIRAYVGLRSAETLGGRAELLLDELIRTGAFDREVLVVATTTGTGFLDPNAITALEYLYKGDVAVAGAQYSYLPSWISLLADQDEVEETSQVVFRTIHEYWSTLPEGQRPEIYLYGLSLGSYGVESILTSINIINEPIDGALMVGPPFVNELWNELVADRDPGTSPATPIYQDGRTVRFTNAESALDIPSAEWGDTRVVYLQHASDPVVFFSPSLFWRQPDWLLDGQRGVEISDEFQYTRFITGWQVMLDLPAAGSIPEGYGHLYSKEANAEAWIAVTRPANWSDDDTSQLIEFLGGLGPSY